MRNIIKYGITSNMLKTIVLIAMVIDHVGFYFAPFLPSIVYSILRAIGRIAMPIFTYLIVQGFFHTKNFKKYVTRILICGVVTQVVITICMFVNINFVPGYLSAKQIYLNGNILFTYAICLITLKLIHEKIIIKKWDYNKNMSLKILLIVLIAIGCALLPLDYSLEATLLSVLLYFIEKLKITIHMEKNRRVVSVKSIMANIAKEETIKKVYIALILVALILIMIYFNTKWYILISIIPIAIYNNEKGKDNKFMKYSYYVIFPLQHVLLYSLAMITTLT